VFYN